MKIIRDKRLLESMIRLRETRDFKDFAKWLQESLAEQDFTSRHSASAEQALVNAGRGQVLEEIIHEVENAPDSIRSLREQEIHSEALNTPADI